MIVSPICWRSQSHRGTPLYVFHLGVIWGFRIELLVLLYTNWIGLWTSRFLLYYRCWFLGSLENSSLYFAGRGSYLPHWCDPQLVKRFTPEEWRFQCRFPTYLSGTCRGKIAAFWLQSVRNHLHTGNNYQLICFNGQFYRHQKFFPCFWVLEKCYE